MNHVAGRGASIITPDARTSLVNSPEAVAATEWMNDLVWKWKVAPTPEQGALSVFSFESGRLAMEMDSSGESPRMRDAVTKFEWDVAPGPAGPNGYRSGHNAHILVMASGTRVPEAAWRFMSFMVSPEAERLLGCRLRRCIPTRKAIALSDEYLSADRPPFNMRAFIAGMDAPQPEWPYNEKWAEWVQCWQDHLDRVWLSGEPAKEVLDEAAVDIDAILRGERD